MIEVEHVVKKFGSFHAVDDVSFSIQTGEIIGLLGPNGAGKTTTMRMITGFLEPTSGCVKIDGMDVTEFPVETKAKVGYMPESAPLYGDMIVADYLTYVAQMEGKDPAEKVKQLSEICGLKEVMHKNISELSRGNRQRVGLAHALMGDPEILILDEPTSGLDPNQVQGVRNLITEIGKTRTVIVSTHILSEVETLCSRVIIINGGKKVADSPTEELREKFGSSSQVELLVGKENCSAVESSIKSLPYASSVKTQEEENFVRLIVTLTGSQEVRHELSRLVVQANCNLYELTIKKNSLEDVFRTLTVGGES